MPISNEKKQIPVIGYGAPTMATLLLKLANLKKNSIDFIVEDNPLKYISIYPNMVLKLNLLKN